MDEKKVKEISKFLSLVLRHAPEKINVTLDENGWVEVETLISQCNKFNKQLNREILNFVVETNNKKRFAFNDDGTKIRASQGHSIEVELNLDEVKPLDILYHGTVEKYLETIKIEGLQKMNRQHVHLSKDEETAINVGMRRGKPIILKIKAKELFEEGFKFYLSENKVWLTEFVPAKYIEF